MDEFVILLPDDEGAWERLGPAGQTGDPGGLVEACGLLASGSPVEVRRVARHNT